MRLSQKTGILTLPRVLPGRARHLSPFQLSGPRVPTLLGILLSNS